MTERKEQFKDALLHIQAVKQKATVRVEDVDYLLDAGFKLLLSFEDLEKSRANWRARAEAAEEKYKKETSLK